MSLITNSILKAVDLVTALGKVPLPPTRKLHAAQLVAHRGAHEGRLLKENTWSAFKAANELGAWGIEFDVRWTVDEVPVVMHDPTPARIFPHIKRPVNQMSANELIKSEKEIPLLAELIEGLGKKLHLMIEVKEPVDSIKKKQKFQQLLSTLEPSKDFHILSLNPSLFEDLDFLPSSCFLPVAEWNVKVLSQMAVERGWAGLTGHYQLISNQILHQHNESDQKVGTGFIASRACLFRELNRDVEWLFTDQVKVVKGLLSEAQQSCLDDPGSPR